MVLSFSCANAGAGRCRAKGRKRSANERVIKDVRWSVIDSFAVLESATATSHAPSLHSTITERLLSIIIEFVIRAMEFRAFTRASHPPTYINSIHALLFGPFLLLLHLWPTSAADFIFFGFFVLSPPNRIKLKSSVQCLSDPINNAITAT